MRLEKKLPILALAFFGAVIAVAVSGGSLLVVNAPRHSDVILVLAGETDHRPARALQLFDDGYAAKIILDVPIETKIYEFTQMQLAQKYIQNLSHASSVSICPIKGLSTKEEARDTEPCLARENGKSVLLVTSDFHSRRAFSIFQKELPAYSFSVAAASDDSQFGIRWWTRRQWAKTFLNESLRLFWWEAVDKWH